MLYFESSTKNPSEESSVFEWSKAKGIINTRKTFKAWLFDACTRAREVYSVSEWDVIKLGSPPFSAYENSIANARKQFRWQQIGITQNGELMFEIENCSTMRLPYLTLLARSKDNTIDDFFWVSTHSISPGETHLITKACYKGIVSPAQLEISDAPDPLPEDRERYWEFRTNERK